MDAPLAIDAVRGTILLNNEPGPSASRTGKIFRVLRIRVGMVRHSRLARQDLGTYARLSPHSAHCFPDDPVNKSERRVQCDDCRDVLRRRQSDERGSGEDERYDLDDPQDYSQEETLAEVDLDPFAHWEPNEPRCHRVRESIEHGEKYERDDYSEERSDDEESDGKNGP